MYSSGHFSKRLYISFTKQSSRPDQRIDCAVRGMLLVWKVMELDAYML